MAVHRDLHLGAHLVQLEVEWNTEGDGPVVPVEARLDHLAVEIDCHHVFGSQLFPMEQPWVAPERAIAPVDRDVAGQMIVVTLAPEGAGQQRQLLPR